MAPKATLNNFFFLSITQSNIKEPMVIIIFFFYLWSLLFITPIIHICIISKVIYRVLNKSKKHKSMVQVNYIPKFTQETGKVLCHFFIYFLSKSIFNLTIYMYVYLHFCCLTNSSLFESLLLINRNNRLYY